MITQMKSKQKMVSVTPLSSKAKNRFANIMDRFHACRIEQETESMFFLVSINGQYCFWIQKEGNEHWKIEK